MTNLELKQARDTAAAKCIELFHAVKTQGIFLKQPLLELQILGQVHGLICKQIEAEARDGIVYLGDDPIENAVCELKTARRDNPHHDHWLSPIIDQLDAVLREGGAS